MYDTYGQYIYTVLDRYPQPTGRAAGYEMRYYGAYYLLAYFELNLSMLKSKLGREGEVRRMKGR